MTLIKGHIDKTLYYSPYIREKMTRYTFRREVALLSHKRKYAPLRFLRAGFPQNWVSIFKHSNFFERNYSIYMSTSFYDQFPFIPFGKERRQKLHEWFDVQFDHLIGQDFLLDVDLDCASSVDTEIADVQKILEGFFMKFECPYELRFSGRGLHLVIPYYFFEHLGLSLRPDDENNLYDFYKDFNVDLKHHLDIPEIDTVVNSYGRLQKVPYSLADYSVIPKETSGYFRPVEVLRTRMRGMRRHNRIECKKMTDVVKHG